MQDGLGMKLIVLLFIFLSRQEDVPFKSNEEFDLKLNFEFKTRLPDNSVAFDGSMKKQSGPLPYLNINLKVLRLGTDEVRVRVTRNRGENVMSKKAETDMQIKLDMGFTDDIKDQVTANEYTILFLSKEKLPLSRIEILFQKDGTYLVNGEKRGKV